jgi:hypothetical protein
MGQFKPMVKMMTTEPSVVLKLKKGGHVNAKADKKAEHGHKPMGKMDGGVMGALAGTPALVGRPAVNAPVAVPGRPSMAARRKAMMAKPMGRAMPAAIMKEGGKADMAQDKAMIKKAMKQHDAQEHKGGKGTKLNLKTGGVAMGNAGGYKKGGAVAKSGIINTEGQGGEYRNTKMHEAKPDNNSAPTGDVKMGKPGGYMKGGKVQRKAHGGEMKYVEGNVTGTPAGKSNTKTGEVKKSTEPGEYKKGGAAKKYADGGRVQDDGRPVKMPQKAPSDPVAISRLSGTFKKGGSVKKKAEGGPLGTQPNKEEQGEAAWRAGEREENESLRNALSPARLLEKAREVFRGVGAVSDVEREKARTVVPAKKKYGGKAC